MTHPLELLCPPRAGGVLAYPDTGAALPLAELPRQVAGAAEWLTGVVGKGGRVGVIQETHPSCQLAVLGGWWGGHTVGSLPVPARGEDPAAYGASLALLAERCGLDAVVLPPGGAVPAVGGLRLLEVPAAFAPGSAEAHPAREFIQCTSGSTGRPRGVRLDLEALGAHLGAVGERLELDGPLRAVSWLPLSHDMGFVGTFLTCVAEVAQRGGRVTLSTPGTYRARPAHWPLELAGQRAGLTAAPDTSWRLLARQLGTVETLDLSGLRRALNGAEPVRPATLAALCAAGERHGLDPAALGPCYGMAEIGLAVSIHASGAPRAYAVGREALAAGRLSYAPLELGVEPPAGERAVAACGAPLRGVEVRVGGGAVVGRLEIRSGQLFTGYAGEAARSGAWWPTPDVGFLTGDGAVVVLGRADDVLNVAGLKYHPEDLEAVVGDHEAIHTGAVAAVAGVDGGWQLVVAPRRGADPAALERVLRRRLAAAGAPTPGRVLLVDRRTFPLTPSGKPRRHQIAARHRR